MNLTPHFSLEELTFSETAARLGIDNTPNGDVIENLKRTAAGLENVRIILNANAIKVSSGYRCEALEKVICHDAYVAWCNHHGHLVNDASWAQYFATKQHSKGQAADFTCQTFGNPERIMRAVLASRLDFDQLIFEFNSWVHISFADVNRKQVWTIDHDGTRPFV